MRVAFVTPEVGDNSTGRTYCLWLLAEALGWESVTLAYGGSSVWPPLAGSRFAETIRLLPSDRARAQGIIATAAERADVVVAVKPVRDSFGLCLGAGGPRRFPLVLDIDDPDLEVVLGNRTPRARRLAKWLARTRTMSRAFALRRQATTVPRLVSNPELQRLYGGTLLPHVRPLSETPVAVPRGDDEVRVVFVGTNRAHKGVGLLRSAVRRLAREGYTLTVTDAPPEDAQPWERWTGMTTLAEGAALVATADVVALPSLDTPWAWGQLPAKLVDAMLAGVPTVVSSIDPMPWAVADGGLQVRPGDEVDLVEGLRALRSPATRARIGARAAERARAMFSVEANAGAFADLLRAAAS